MARKHDREFARLCKRLGVTPFVDSGIASDEEVRRLTLDALVEAVANLYAIREREGATYDYF